MARPLTSASTASEYSPKFSPDGRWLAYVVDQQERSEVYVRGYPSGEPIPCPPPAARARSGAATGGLSSSSAQSGGRALMSVPVSVDGAARETGRALTRGESRTGRWGRVWSERLFGSNATCFQTATS